MLLGAVCRWFREGRTWKRTVRTTACLVLLEYCHLWRQKKKLSYTSLYFWNFKFISVLLVFWRTESNHTSFLFPVLKRKRGEGLEYKKYPSPSLRGTNKCHKNLWYCLYYCCLYYSNSNTTFLITNCLEFPCKIARVRRESALVPPLSPCGNLPKKCNLPGSEVLHLHMEIIPYRTVVRIKYDVYKASVPHKL